MTIYKFEGRSPLGSPIGVIYGSVGCSYRFSCLGKYYVDDVPSFVHDKDTFIEWYITPLREMGCVIREVGGHKKHRRNV